MAPVEAVEAWQLKQDGVDLPWGARVEEQRNCGEQVGHGFYEFGVGTVEGLGSLISYNPMKGEWGDWDHAGQSWAGIGDVVVSLVVVTSPALMGTLYATGHGDWVAERGETLTEVGKSMIAWDTWEDAPAQAATETILNIGTAFIPVGGAVFAGLKGLSKAAGATRITGMLNTLDNLGPAAMSRLTGPAIRLDFDIDIDIDGARVDVDGPRVDADGPRVNADGPDTPGVATRTDSDTNTEVRDTPETTNAEGHNQPETRAPDTDNGNAGKTDSNTPSPGAHHAVDDVARAHTDTATPDSATSSNSTGGDHTGHSSGHSGDGEGSPDSPGPTGVGAEAPVVLQRRTYMVDGELYTSRPIPPAPEIPTAARNAGMTEDVWTHTYVEATHHMGTANTAVLGKFDGPNDPASYQNVARTEGHAHFSLEDSHWSGVRDAYNLTDSDMFDLFNKPFLDEIGSRNMNIKFTHDPLPDFRKLDPATGKGTALAREYQWVEQSPLYGRADSTTDWIAKHIDG